VIGIARLIFWEYSLLFSEAVVHRVVIEVDFLGIEEEVDFIQVIAVEVVIIIKILVVDLIITTEEVMADHPQM
jgi:hypothetical protein